MKLLFACVAFVAIAAVSARRQRCFPIDEVTEKPECIKANTHYEKCGTACPRNCSNYAAESIGCTKNCVKGCFCDKGYVIVAEKNCIAISKCPAVTPVCTADNEEYSECNAICQRSCGPARACEALAQDCNPGCVCKQGYVRETFGGGKCIKEEECTPVCIAANTHYENCGTACPRNCSNYAEESIPCTKNCVKGCFCDEGYVVDTDGSCIEISECPAVEPVCEAANTHYENCGSACPRNCINYAQESIICTKQCVSGCYCDEGYVFDADQKCVKECDCPAFPPNEEYSKCGANGCQNTCENPTREVLCRGRCVEGFVCVDGYVRNKEKVCTKQEECPDVPSNRPEEIDQPEFEGEE